MRGAKDAGLRFGARLIVPIFSVISGATFVLATFPPSVAPPKEVPPLLKDMSGAQVHFNLPAKRIILFPSILPTFLTIDEGPSHLAGIPKVSLEDIEASVLGRSIYPSVAQTPIVGAAFVPTAANVEEIMRLNPDAVITLSQPSLGDPLREVGMPHVMEVSYDSDTVADWEMTWRLMGILTGRSRRVEWILRRYKPERDDAISPVPNSNVNRPNAVAMNSYSGNYSILSLPSYWINWDLGLEKVLTPASGMKWGWRYAQDDPEEAMRINPDFIFMFCQASNDHCLSDIYRDSRYQPVTAIRKRQVYRIPEYTWTDWQVEEPLMLYWLTELLHPDGRPSRLRLAYKQIYQDIYHYRLEDDELDRMIYLRENLQSAGYQRLMRPVLVQSTRP